MQRSFALTRGKIDLETRAFELNRGEIDMETGEFWATVATNGPASDNHILDIKTARVAEQVPMFADHVINVTRQLGTWTQPRKVGKSTRLAGASLKMLGRLRQDGDGEMPDIRRDVANGIHSGDITKMSVHWDPVFTSVLRRSLPKSHFAFSEIQGGWEDPLFITDWELLENSVVGLPADKAALVGRSQDLKKPEHVRQFYDVLIHGDPQTREEMMVSLFELAAGIDDLESIDTAHGPFYVPKDVARVWGQSIEDAAPAARSEVESVDTVESAIERLGGPTAEELSDPDFSAEDWIIRDVLRAKAALGKAQSVQTMNDEQRHFAVLCDAARDTDAYKTEREALEREEISLSGDSKRVVANIDSAIEGLGRATGIIDALGNITESTESEPVSAPESEMTERDEPVSVPPLAATASADVALLELPKLPVRPEVIREGIAKGIKDWKATELGYIE